jgi:hypothetical protein
MLTLVALLLVHVSVTVPPLATVDCDALNVTLGAGGGAAATETVTDAEAFPPVPLAVI